MRRRTAASVSASILICLAVLLRNHARDLFEVASTYSTFHRWVNSHPEYLYRYSADANSFNVSTTMTEADAVVPRIIHQVYLSGKGSMVPEKYMAASAACRALHPSWTFELWTDERASEFLRQNYAEMFTRYSNYQQTIQRANMLRYVVLHHHGGVYLDLDVECLHPLDSLRHLPFLTPGAYPAGVNNAFILSRPGHGFLKHLLQQAASRNIRWGLPYVENMMTTGCMFFSNRWMSYVRTSAVASSSNINDKVLILSDEHGDMDPHMLRGVVTTPLFHHGGASSWHTWDAALILFVGKHYVSFLLGVALTVAASGAVMIMLICRARLAATDNARRTASVIKPPTGRWTAWSKIDSHTREDAEHEPPSYKQC